MTSKKSLSVKLALAISLLCFLLGCMFLALPNSLTKEVFAETGHNHTGWTGVTELPTEAGDYNVYLTDNITLSSTWTVPTGTTNLCLNGYVINANGGNFSVIIVGTGATLNLYDCGTTVHNGYVDANGLWHLGTGEGTAKAITGGIITGGNYQVTNSNGGGLRVDKGKFNMYGGNIVGNYALNGAGVHVSSAQDGVDALFNMSGGTISYNNAKNAGGGVSIGNKNVKFTMTGGEITNNVVNSNFGGGVFTQSDITLGGTAKITDNTANGVTNNVYLYGKTITLDNPTTMSVGVTTYTVPTKDNPVKITADGTADYSSNFFSDSDSYKVCVNNNGTDDNNGDDYLELRTAYAITNYTKEDDKTTNNGYIDVDKNAVEGEKVVVTVVPNSGYKLSSLIYNDGTDHDITATAGVYSFAMPASPVSITAEFLLTQIHNNITFVEWTSNNSLPSVAGNWFLNCDVNLSATWEVPAGTTNLCLNGHVINANGGAFSVITINSGATLNLYDCDTTTSHNGYVDNTGLWHLDIADEHNGQNDEKDIIGGIITGGNKNDNEFTNGGGGIYNGGVFTMNGGTIAGCVAKTNGGGVFNANSFTMIAGSIQYCKTLSTENSKGLGGGVYNYNGATFTLSGGTIENNIASRHGGGVQNCGSGTFVMTAGSIINNIAKQYAGGINSDNVCKLFGGIITGNTASTQGGGLRSNGADMLGGNVNITGNTEGTSNVASNVYLRSGRTIAIGTNENAPTTMQIGITLANGAGKFTADGTADYSSNFFSDSDSYKVCFNAGTATAGDEYLELKKKVTFDEEYLWNNGTPITYGDTYSENAPKVYFNNEEVTGVIFTYTYYVTTDGETWTKLDAKPTNAGSYKVEIAVSEDNTTYAGVLEVEFTIAQKEISLTWSTLTDEQLVYSGTAKTLTATATGLETGDTCEVTASVTTANTNINVGTFTFTAGSLTNPNYKLPINATSPEYTITAKSSLTNDAIQTIADQTYTGSAITPSIVVKDGNITLVEDVDYTVAYANNIEVGTATVTVTLQGNYSGTISKTFIINQAENVACFMHWIMIGLLIAGAALFALFQVFKKKLFAMITCIVAIVGTILCIIFGGCTICIVFTIINLLAFLGGLAYNVIQQKGMTKEDTNKNTK